MNSIPINNRLLHGARHQSTSSASFTNEKEIKDLFQNHLILQVLFQEQTNIKADIRTLTNRIDRLDSKIDKINTDLNLKIDKVTTDLSSKIDKVNTDLSSKIDTVNGTLISLRESLAEKAIETTRFKHNYRLAAVGIGVSLVTLAISNREEIKSWWLKKKESQ